MLLCAVRNSIMERQCPDCDYIHAGVCRKCYELVLLEQPLCLWRWHPKDSVAASESLSENSGVLWRDRTRYSPSVEDVAERGGCALLDCQSGGTDCDDSAEFHYEQALGIPDI